MLKDEWKEICKEYARQHNATLLFVNEDSFGIECKNGLLRHIYVDELLYELMNKKGAHNG